MTRTSKVSWLDNTLVGMVHVGALPGTPGCRDGLELAIVNAVAEAMELAQGGCDALIIENMHDVPYLRREVGPEIIAGMTAVGSAIRQQVDVPLGVQILAGANKAALAVALACKAQFIRAEGFVFASVADEGLLSEADAGPLLRYRRQIGAEHIAIFADIKKKHSSHAITSDVDIAEMARAAEFFRADGVIITGTATGAPVDTASLESVRAATSLPVLVGSGVRPDTARDMLCFADGLIVGSALKRDGCWSNPVDGARVAEMSGAIRAGRSTD